MRRTMIIAGAVALLSVGRRLWPSGASVNLCGRPV